VTVYAVNYPLQYFAERIGGEHVRVVFPAPPDEDPAFWTPDAETIGEYQTADLILLNGASYAKWTRTVSLPETKMVDTSASVSDQYIEIEDAVTHAHGPGGEHAHTGTAFTTWLDPALAIAQADAIRQALIILRPQQKPAFDTNFAALEADLLDLGAKITTLVLGKSDRPIFFSHPVYQYLQRRYKLNGRSIHWEPDEVPSQMMWDELAALREQHPAKWMVWEGTPIEETVKRLDELGLRSTVYDPCGNAPKNGDFFTVMRHNVENLAKVLAE
jgi:zinc transport system substrate-binding protein